MSNYECKQFTDWYAFKQDIYIYTWTLVAVMCLLVLPVVVINAFILTAIVRTPTLHTPSNILTCHFAAANLGLALIGTPSGVAWRLLELYHHDYDVVCTITFFGYSICGLFNGGSVLTLVFATLDRYLALIFHLRYPVIVTNGRTIFLCIISWLASLIAILLLLVGGNTYYIVVSIIMVFLLVVIVYCYSKIFTITRRHHNQIANQAGNAMAVVNHYKRYRKSALNLFYVVCCQFAFLTPYLFSIITFAFHGVSVASLRFWSVSTCFLFLNSLVNPLIIYMSYGELRAAIKNTARSCWIK
ncbi:trace amine-associated receptor 7d-like [Exaiptasia diaphana]|uniref:G-protein coupled receptors family 1 profile domain-containing protein n=1 Tax=Exaiptasia diaphana TaxID=2652724 RepID=A0A913YKM2_EXADI|nr:trace amine-associated receptor 7d-like [Exaiptasia diaphana]